MIFEFESDITDELPLILSIYLIYLFKLFYKFKSENVPFLLIISI